MTQVMKYDAGEDTVGHHNEKERQEEAELILCFQLR